MVMNGADADGDAGTQPGRRWDVALSFAGTQREYVAKVAEALKARHVRCFYDVDEEIRLWGTHLAEELPRIYARESAVVVVFISADYAAGDWTRLERRAAFSEAVAAAGVYVLPARFDDSDLPGLLSDVVTVDLRRSTPEQFADLLVAKLAALGIGPSPPSGGVVRGPMGGVRVSDADPRRLGVHAALSVPGVPDEVPPEYVPRDIDEAKNGVRVSVATAAERGGFVLLVGGSCVGKTRCAVEAIRALLPDWWLVHPADPAEVAALAAAPSPRTVVWLDELQRYLDGDQGITGSVVRALLNARHPAVIIGTLWPDRFTAYTTMPVQGSADQRSREREVLDLAAVIRIGPEFSPAEYDRARAAAARDPRLAIALQSAGYGPTQTLAAAVQLVGRWEDARTANPYAWAMLTAALDVARLGARAPLSADLLRAAAPGYCTSQQQAEAPGDWFEQALAYSAEKLHGAAACLSPAGTGMGQITGYIAHDYLIQHASRERRDARLPASTWDALLSHISDPADTARLADSAKNRMLYRYAIPLYQAAINAGDRSASWPLADLLARRGDVDGLRALTDAGDRNAAWRLTRLLADRSDLDSTERILRASADAGNDDSSFQLAVLLANRGDMRELRRRADAGDPFASFRLVELLVDRGDLDQLRTRADAGDRNAAGRLAWTLAERGDFDEAQRILRPLADAGDKDSAAALALLLADRGDLDELRAQAGTGDAEAAMRLADVLARRGDLDELRARAGNGDMSAVWRLVELLADRGDLDDAERIIRTQADVGKWPAAERLAKLLADRDELDEAEQIIRTCASSGERLAVWRLTELLADRGDLDEAEQILRTWADVGDISAEWRLAKLLADRGDLDELRARANAGGWAAASRLAELLAYRGDLDELRARVNAGDRAAAEPLAWLLAKQGRGKEAERLRWFGLNPDGSIACA